MYALLCYDFTGLAHLRSKWAVCGPLTKMSLTPLLYMTVCCFVANNAASSFLTTKRAIKGHILDMSADIAVCFTQESNFHTVDVSLA